MNSPRIWFLIIGLTMSAFGFLYFFRSASTSAITVPSSPVAKQANALNPASLAPMPAQPTYTTPPAPNSPSSSPAYQYNAQGQLQSIIYHDGSTYTYQYNSQGDKIREIDGKTGKAWTYLYDQNNHPIRILDPEGREMPPK